MIDTEHNCPYERRRVGIGPSIPVNS